MSAFDKIRSSDKNGRRKVTELLCFSPDLAEEYQAHVLQASAAKQSADSRDPEAKSTRRLGDEPAWVRHLKDAAALVESNPDSFYDVVLEQSRRHDWLRLLTDHSPRDSVDADEGRYNSDTFPEAALALSLRDPEPTDENLEFFADNLSTGEWRRLAVIIWNLNEGVRSVPKADQVSSILGAYESN